MRFYEKAKKKYKMIEIYKWNERRSTQIQLTRLRRILEVRRRCQKQGIWENGKTIMFLPQLSAS